MRLNLDILFLKVLPLLLIPFSLSGQLTPVSNQYILNPIVINPAHAGSNGLLNIAAFYRKQWIGVAGSPETMTLAIDGPLLDSKLGLGLLISSDKIGVTKESRLNTIYAYRIKRGEGMLSFGLGAGLIATNTAWSDLVVVDKEDSHYLSDSRVFIVPDFNFGVNYRYHNYFAAFSIPKLLGYNFNFNKNKYTIQVNPEQYNMLFNTGYRFSLSSDVKFLPSVLVSFSPGKELVYDINAHFSFFDRFWAGFSYRNNRSMSGLMQFSVNNKLKLAYIYDFDFEDLSRYSNGSHEIMFRYEFRYKLDAVNPLNF